MRMGFRTRLAAPAVLAVLLAGGSSSVFAAPPRVAADAVIETIAFEGVLLSEHEAILDRIGVRVGDRLTVEARQRIGRRLNPLGGLREFSLTSAGLTFSDRPGSKPGTVVLVIAAGGC